MQTSTIPLYNTFRSLFYAGRTVTCPVCGRSFRKMMPGGNNRRPNARCPFCDALERHRLLWLFIREKTALLKKERSLLHFAPEPCFIRAFRKVPTISYTSADLSSPLAMVHTDITDLEFHSSSFDYILCCHVLEHIENDMKALHEMKRVLKPQGSAIIMTPVNFDLETTKEDPPESTPELRKKLFGAEDHLRLYGADFTSRLEAAGFDVEDCDYYSALPAEKVKKYALPGEEHIYVCSKPA